MTLESNKQFWENKAKENSKWYVSSFVSYDDPDASNFWQSGFQIWEDVKSYVDYRPNAHDTVVEIGCGIGRLTRAICEEVGHVHATDISSEMIRQAQEHSFNNVSFHVGNGDDLAGLPSTGADFVIAYNVFQHLPSTQVLQQYLSEMIRVAKPNTKIAFTLSIRDKKTFLLPLLRFRRYLKEMISCDGPRDLYKSEWVGIRPNPDTVQSLCGIPISRITIHDNKWLFQGTKPSVIGGEA